MSGHHHYMIPCYGMCLPSEDEQAQRVSLHDECMDKVRHLGAHAMMPMMYGYAYMS